MSDRRSGNRQRRDGRNNDQRSENRNRGNRSSRQQNNRDRDDGGGGVSSRNSGAEASRRPIILAKPDRDKDKDFPSLSAATGGGNDSSAANSDPTRKPVLLSRRGEAAQNSSGGTASTEKISSPSRPTKATTSLPTASAPNESNAADFGVTFKKLPVPSRCFKLIDENQFSESIMSYLSEDNTDFRVVGIVGQQSTGKTCLINALVNETQGGEPARHFRPQSFDKQMLSEQCTNGVNVWIGPNRVIYLDTQGLMSGAVLDRVIVQAEKKYSEFGSAENTLEVQSLQLLGFLMNICHVIIVVQDWFCDEDQLFQLKIAESLKPRQPAPATLEDHAQIVDYYPDLLFVQNKASSGDFSTTVLNAKRQHLREVMEQSSLKYDTSLTDGEDVFNFCAVPNFDEEYSQTAARTVTATTPHFEEAVRNLRHAVSKAKARPLSSSKLTESGWLAFAQRSWNTVKNYSFYMEYNRLL